MSLTIQFYTMISMVMTGGYLGASLDTYNRFLVRSKRQRWVVFIYDFLFWTIQALVTFNVLFFINEAELRFYIFIAILCGYATYQSLFRLLYLKWLEKIIRFIIKCYNLLSLSFHHVVVRPILLLVKVIIAVLLFVLHVIQRIGNVLLAIIMRILLIISRILLFFVPRKIQTFFSEVFVKCAGLFGKVKNIRTVMQKLWKKFRD